MSGKSVERGPGCSTVIGKVLGLALRIFLVIALLIVVIAGIWLTRKVETGVGEMTRWEAGLVYLKLASEKQPADCKVIYLGDVFLGLIVAPLEAIDAAYRGEIIWVTIPAEALRYYGEGMHVSLHGHPDWAYKYECRLSEPSEWTPDMIGR